ncbi:MAG: DUF1499 domain-containing protein [Reyranella sp.]|uniref:DUF1499 domain-containing protein n=1 Tax=Reyranella sp. TaxID=1929291 RepID=UPI001AD5645C|nr:DUF1499 domain-containing protein [Reyranella sp.]MBN9087348.1 DUF1499 domain-containing protein [Reyranella sp.]
MFHRPTNPVSHRLARLAFYLACLAALTVAACGPAHRYLRIDLDIVLIVFRFGFYLAAASVALALATIVPARPGDRRRGFVAAILALGIGVAAAWMPAQWLLRARAAPRINDVTTDTANVPAMVVTQQMRHGSPNPPAYPGPATATLQRAAYPDIVPIVLNAPPADAFRKVDAAAMALGWEVVARAPADGRIEATDTSDWFGLTDDIVIRIRREGAGGSRIDIRSKSRVGESDFGVNARRIRAFIERVRQEG